MNKTEKFLFFSKKLSNAFVDTESQEELARNINELLKDKKKIGQLTKNPRQNTNKFEYTSKIIVFLNMHWADISQEVDNIRELIDDKLNYS